MRIAMIGGYRGLPSGLPGSAGGETYQEQLAVRLAQRGHQVTAYNRLSYCSRAFGKEYRGVRLHYLPAAPWRSAAMLSHSLLASCHIALRDTADLVQLHGVGASLWIPLLRAAQKRSVVMVGGSVDWQRPSRGPLARVVLRLAARAAGRWADALYVDNHAAQPCLEGVVGRPITYLPTGTETWPDPGDDGLAAFSLQRRDYVFHASTLNPDKGVRTLLEAFLTVRGDSRLVVAGGRRAGAPPAYLVPHGDARVIFPGHVGGTLRQQLYSHAAVYVQPSLAEGTSPSLLAAMGCGVCPLVSDIPSNLEVIGDAGVAFRAGDAAELGAKLQMLLDDPAMAAELGVRASTRARGLFDWERIVDSFEELCNGVMAR